MTTARDRARPKLAFTTIGATAPFPALVRASLSASFLQALARAGYTDLLIQYGSSGRAILDELVPSSSSSSSTAAAALQTAALPLPPRVVSAPTADGSSVTRAAHGVRITGFAFRTEGLRGCMAGAAGRGIPASEGEAVARDAGRRQRQPTAGVQRRRREDGAEEEEEEEEGWEQGMVVSHAGSGSVLEALRLAAPLVVVPNPALLDDHQAELAGELERQGYVVRGTTERLEAVVEEVERRREGWKGWPPVNSGEGGGIGRVLDEEVGYGLVVE